MALSTMQEIFILLEDEKKVPLFRINRWGRPARGALAKLKNLGWAEKKKENEEDYYQITHKGEEYVDSTLNILKQNIEWDKKWRLVMFDIPETERATRDKLRRALDNLGLGILQASVWISTQDVKAKIEEIRNKLNLGTQIKYFEVTSSPSIDAQIVEKAWNLPDLNLQFERFIKEAEWALKNIGKGIGDRYTAKKLIFEYALILSKDPKLPEEFIEKNDLRKGAKELYQQLRRFAV